MARFLRAACASWMAALLVPAIAAAEFDGFALEYQIDDSVGMARAFPIDFDGDSDLDLVEVYGAPERIRTFSNDGSGVLKFEAESLLPDAAFVVDLGDANGDGTPDLAWAQSVGSGNSPVTIFHGRPDGSFELGQTLRRTNDVGGLAFGHLNADSALDLVVARRSGSVDFYVNDAAGSLQRSGRARQRGKDVADVAIGDFDDDGDADVLTLTHSGELFFYEQRSGSFANGKAHATVARQARSLAAVDLNGDATPDLVIATGETASCPDHVYRANGDGTFSFSQSLCNPSHADGTTELATGDLNGDGIVDIVALRGGDLYYLGLGDATFGPPQAAFTPPVFFAFGVALGDLNEDGYGDAFVRDGRCCNTPTNVYLGQPWP